MSQLYYIIGVLYKINQIITSPRDNDPATQSWLGDDDLDLSRTRHSILHAPHRAVPSGWRWWFWQPGPATQRQHRASAWMGRVSGRGKFTLTGLPHLHVAMGAEGRAGTWGPPVGAKGLAAAMELTVPMGLGFRLAGLRRRRWTSAGFSESGPEAVVLAQRQ
jgi:hypothetical protein